MGVYSSIVVHTIDFSVGPCEVEDDFALHDLPDVLSQESQEPKLLWLQTERDSVLRDVEGEQIYRESSRYDDISTR